MASNGVGTAGDVTGGAGGLVRTDPTRTIAIAMIVASVLWRAQISSRGFLAADDYVLVTQSAESALTPEYLLALYNNHFMPGGRLLTWLVTEAFGLVYWPYVLLMAAGQAVLAVAFYRLLRTLLRPSRLMLVPLGMFLFSPLTLEATSWWAVGANMLPMQLSMVLALGAQVKYVRTGRRRHLLSLAAAVLLGLLFFEKALLVVPLVFLFTAFLFADGGPVRTVVTTVRRWWPSWLVLTALVGGFAAVYLTRSESSLRRPESVGEVLSFLTQVLGTTLVPGLLGGPWGWLGAGDGAPVAAPPELGRWIAWTVFAALVLLTVRRDRTAGRAWVLLATYLVMVAGLLAATRLGSVFSAVAGGVPRYVSDVVVVAAICVGVALVGVARTGAAGTAPAGGAREADPGGGGAATEVRSSGVLDGATAGVPAGAAASTGSGAAAAVAGQPVGPPHPAPAVPAPPAPTAATRPVPAMSARIGVIHAEAPPEPTADELPAPGQAVAGTDEAPAWAATVDATGVGAPVAGDDVGPTATATPPGGGSNGPGTPATDDAGAEPVPTDATTALGDPAARTGRPWISPAAGGTGPGEPPPPPDWLAPVPARYREVVSAGLALLLVAGMFGTAWTTSRYGDEWSKKYGRSYLDTARIELASAPPGTVFFDAPVPSGVLSDLSSPYNMQSRFFTAVDGRPEFVRQTENASVLDGLGRIQVGTIQGSTIRPGAREGCGYFVGDGETVRMPLDQPRFEWNWIVRIGYLASTDGTAVLRLGGGSHEFPVKRGLNQRFFTLDGAGGDTVELTVRGPGLTLCTNEIAIGDIVPKPE